MPKTCEQAVAEYFAAIRAMDPERFANVFAPDGVSYDPVGTPPHEGRDALRAMLTHVVSGFKQVGLTENNVYVCGNSAAVQWTGQGTTHSGKDVTFYGIDVIDCNEQGEIVLVRAFWDPAPVSAALQG